MIKAHTFEIKSSITCVEPFEIGLVRKLIIFNDDYFIMILFSLFYNFLTWYLMLWDLFSIVLMINIAWI